MEGLEIESVEVGVTKDGQATIPVPEGLAPTPPPVATEFSGKPGNLMADLAALRAEQNPAPVAVLEPVVTPEPEQSATTPATPVPAKFQDAEGKVDQAKVEKSLFNAEQALAKYQEIEKQMRQKQNEVAALKLGSPIPVTPTAQANPQNVQLSPFEIQVAQDLINEAAAAGYQMPQGQAIAQARVTVRLYEAKHSADASLTEGIRQKLEDQDRRRELEAIGQEDQSIFTPEGVEALQKIRLENPWVDQSPKPWQTAYDIHLANQIRQQRLNGQVQTPTPTAKTAKAPPTPVNAAPRVVVKPMAPTLETKEQVDAHVSNMTREQEAAFWKSRGFKF